MVETEIRVGKVTDIQEFAKRQELLVEIADGAEKAINFPHLTGNCQIGDQVVINTTAQTLALGSGGYHFVMAIVNKTRDLNGAGHIMKLRYTPLQGRVLSVEEEESPYHGIFRSEVGVQGMPVVVGSLHSMLAPVALGFKHRFPTGKLVYIMTDGAALPLGFSRLVESLVEQELIAETITFGHAFGGTHEAVNIYTALLTAKFVCKAAAAVVLMGPGVVGTGTQWGTTSLEQGSLLDAVHLLAGRGVAILRISMADKRERHQGISHHSLTALAKIAQKPCYIPLPTTARNNPKIVEQLALLDNHIIKWYDPKLFTGVLEHATVSLNSMGRDFDDDPLFFQTPLLAGALAAEFAAPDTNHQG